jgi:hypothetical protein
VLDLGHKLRAWEAEKFNLAHGITSDQMRLPGPMLRTYLVRNLVSVLPGGRAKLDVRTNKEGRSTYLARSEDLFIAWASSSLLVAAQRVGFTRLEEGIVLCGGDVELQAGGSIVLVCDGDVVTKKCLAVALVVSRGSVRLAGDVSKTVILAGGDVSFSERSIVRNVIVRAAGSVTLPKKARAYGHDLKGKVANALALAPVKFFDPASVGVAVAPAKFGVRVTTATPGQPFARAGLAIDDLVTALDGRPVPSPQAFRRLLRKRLVEGGTALFEVRRAGRKVEVRVPLGLGSSPLLER